MHLRTLLKVLTKLKRQEGQIRLKISMKIVPRVPQTWVRTMTFETYSGPIASTPEERMSRVFGNRIKGEPPKSTSRFVVGKPRSIAGVLVPSKPLEPDNCCMSGCVNCVWESYNDQVRYWRDQRIKALKEIEGTDYVWPEDWNPPLAQLDWKNVPESLKNRKRELMDSVNVSKIFTKRQSSLPQSVLDAKRRIRERRNRLPTESSDDEGWEGVPIYIKVFSEFERTKKNAKYKHP